MPYKDKGKKLEWNKNHYIKNIEKYKQRAMDQRRVLAGLVYRFKKRNGCHFCPETDPVCLDFHHRDPKDKTDTINKLVKMRVKPRVLIDEMQKCFLCCANCHRKKDINYQYNQLTLI